MRVQLYDSVNPNAIPSTARAVAGYVGGMWPDYSILVQRFPHARHKSVAVNAQEDADILDVEAGDATPDQAPGWLLRQHRNGNRLPGIYANASTMPEVIRQIEHAGIARSQYVLWVAAWDDIANIPSGFNAKQYIDHGPRGENYDMSLADDSFWGVSQPVKNSMHYDWFSNRSFRLFKKSLNERSIVQRYDKLRATQTKTRHPHRAELAVLRVALGLLAGRVYRVAHDHKLKNGKPSWSIDHKGWRFQQLSGRKHGQRFV